MRPSRKVWALSAAALALLNPVAILAAGQPTADPVDTVRARLPEDEIIYFVLPDRFENGDRRNDTGGIKGDRLKTGFDPAHKGFFHGGDLKGLIDRLDYIQGLGATAIWFAPIFQNKPVQGAPGREDAGYHGYWVTDFTRVDSHFGTNEEFKRFVDAAHARGMKVYMDIIANHTADVIYFKECLGQPDCVYRSRADYPYQRRGGINGPAINAGFAGEEDGSAANFAKLTDPGFAYTPVLPEAEKQIKVPAWLNDPIYYHNRGNTTFQGESSRHGDFAGLDDLMTENPEVVSGFIAIFGDWIDRFGVDGFRIDTARHVNPEFWRAFVPAMLERAKARGIPNFHIFGEVANDAMDPGYLAQYTRRDGFPAVLDFAFQAAVRDMFTGKSGTEVFGKLIDGDVLYEGGDAAARRLPTFLGNHDMGRFGFVLDQAHPKAGTEERLNRMMLANVLLMTARGVPTIYYGDEQGFVSDGGDQAAREDMFASQVASYNDNVLIGTRSTTATANFDTAHPLYRQIAELSDLRQELAQLRRGRTVVRASDPKPGLLAFTRGADDGSEILVAINTSLEPVEQAVEVGQRSAAFRTLAGTCPALAAAPGSAMVSLPPLGYAICAASPKEEQ